ncbi:MAG TPA: hypothetical protein PK299_10610 [Anaerolineales bacterium]|nr:hypothetical protein [Anaerolineales bacterium]
MKLPSFRLRLGLLFICFLLQLTYFAYLTKPSKPTETQRTNQEMWASLRLLEEMLDNHDITYTQQGTEFKTEPKTGCMYGYSYIFLKDFGWYDEVRLERIMAEFQWRVLEKGAISTFHYTLEPQPGEKTSTLTLYFVHPSAGCAVTEGGIIWR